MQIILAYLWPVALRYGLAAIGAFFVGKGYVTQDGWAQIALGLAGVAAGAGTGIFKGSNLPSVLAKAASAPEVKRIDVSSIAVAQAVARPEIRIVPEGNTGTNGVQP